MLGVEYFEKRLVDIYEYSIMKYTSGTGKLTIGHINCDVNWEAVISVTGDLIFVLSSSELAAFGSAFMREGRGEFSGHTDDGEWSVIATNVLITSHSFQIGKKTSSQLTCIVKDFSMVRKGSDDQPTSHVEGCILGFPFLGLEVTEKDAESWTRDKFTVSVYDRDVVFREFVDRKKILDQIHSNRIDRAIVSSVVMPMHEGETQEALLKYLVSLSWFLSFVNVKATMTPVIRYWNGSTMTGIHYSELISSPHHSNVIIDNKIIHGGLVQFFEECYEAFEVLDEEIDLKVLISLLLGMYEGKFLEHRIASLIMAYEYFLTKYLVKLGHKVEVVKDLSIQDKLKRLNAHMKFIPSRLLGDTLRKDVRNALFHTGELSLIPYEEKFEIYNEYYDLLIQIILRSLGYTGQYISPINYKAKDLL